MGIGIPCKNSNHPKRHAYSKNLVIIYLNINFPEAMQKGIVFKQVSHWSSYSGTND